MAWKKAPAELVAWIAETMASFSCQKRVMFGYPAYFVNDNMFAALHEDREWQ